MGERFSVEEARPKGRRFSINEARGTGGPSPRESFARGVVQSPARMLEGVAALGSGLSSYDDAPLTRLSRGLSERSAGFADEIAPRPVTHLERAVETAGEQVGPALAGAAMGAPGGPAVMAGEAGLALGAPMVGHGVEAMTGSPRAATIAELGLALVAPAAGSRLGSAMRVSRPPALHRLAADRGARDLMLRDPTGQGEFRREAAEALSDEVSKGLPPEDMRTSDMVLAEIAPGVENLAVRKAQQGVGDFSQVLGGRKRRLGKLQDERVERVIGRDAADVDAVRTSWRGEFDRRVKDNERLWESLDLDGAEPASRDFLDGAIATIRREAGQANADALPKKQIRLIESLEDGVPWGELQAIRSRLGSMVEASRSPAASDVARQKGRFARTLRDAVDATIENAPDSIQVAYPEAIASHRVLKQTFDRKSKAYKAFDSEVDAPQLVKEIVDGRNAISEVRRVREMFGQDTTGLDEFRRTVIEDTFLPSTGNKGPAQVQRRYERRRNAIAELFPPEKVRAFDQLAESGVDSSIGKAGRRSQTYGPGSATQRAPMTLGELVKQLGDIGFGNDMLKNRLMERYLLHPEELLPVLEASRFGGQKAVARTLTAELAKMIVRGTQVPSREAFSGEER